MEEFGKEDKRGKIIIASFATAYRKTLGAMCKYFIFASNIVI